MKRALEAEWLDALPPVDPEAVASRRDLRRLNRLMGHASILARLLRARTSGRAPRSVLELGAGDGTFLLDLARRLGPEWQGTKVALLDRHALASPETCRAFAELGWMAEPVCLPIETWVESAARPGPLFAPEIVVANLFLHHFSRARLKQVFARAAQTCAVFASVEPRRALGSSMASHLLRFIGCNRTTRHDAVVSVRAGFRAPELRELWPATPQWRLDEGDRGLFSHTFCAARTEEPRAPD